MTDARVWLQWGNVACLIPILILLVQYVIRTRWNVTDTGRALAYLIILSTVNLSINFVGAVTDDEVWTWIRVVTKFMIAIGMMNLVRVMEQARRAAIQERV